jgi:hypothetical protein
MATSNSYNFSVNATSIVKSSMRILGLIPSGENPTSDELTDGIEALNMLVKQWMHNPNYVMRGFQGWHQFEQILDISALAAKQQYTLGPSGCDQTMEVPVDILTVVKVDANGNRIVVERASLNRFTEWSNRTTEATPTEYYYKRGLTSGTLSFNYKPSDTTEDFIITYVRPLQDIDNVTDDVEFPQEWFRALKFNLAIEMALEYQRPISPVLMKLATDSLDLVQSFDTQDASIFISPDR